MADMEHLFREHEMREQELAGIRTGRFKTALDRAEKAQYNILKYGNINSSPFCIDGIKFYRYGSGNSF